MPLISIIVPCYNQSQYLDECLQSVLHQTFTDWECIIVNDGSPDNTEEVAAKWVEKDARFHYYKKENGGVASARNFGIERAKGEWILPLDGDDKIGNQYLELAVKKCNEGYDIIYCNAEFFGDFNGPWQLNKYSYEALTYNNLIFCTAFYRKSLWVKAGGYDSNLLHGFEDWEFWLSVINPHSKVIQIDEVLFYYRRKADSRGNTANKEIDKKNICYNYIFNKHLQKYIGQNNIIEEVQRLRNIETQYNIWKKQLYKNKLSRFFFKIINNL